MDPDQLHGEPVLEELLDDDVLRRLLDRDGLTVDDVRAVIATARSRLAAPADSDVSARFAA